MRNRKAIRLRPSQGGSMARSVGPDDETRARIAASDAKVLDAPTVEGAGFVAPLYLETAERAPMPSYICDVGAILVEDVSQAASEILRFASSAARLAAPAQVMVRSRRDGRSYFIPSPGDASTNGWQPLDETLFYDANDGDVAIVSRVDVSNRMLLCKFYHSTGKCRTPLMTMREDETTGWRELTPDEVRSFREKIAKAHGQAYADAIHVERAPQAVNAGQWYDTGGAYLEVIKVCGRNSRHLCDVYRRNGELMARCEPFSGKELSTHRMLTEDESMALRNTIEKKEIGYNEFDFI